MKRSGLRHGFGSAVKHGHNTVTKKEKTGRNRAGNR